jgi:transposase
LSREPKLRAQQSVLERRRLAAANLFAQGVSAAAVALRLGVSRQSLHRWYRAWRAGGVQALRARGPIGRHRKLLPAQPDQVEHALLRELVPTGSRALCGRWSVSPEVIWRLTGCATIRCRVADPHRPVGLELATPAPQSR